MGGWQWKFVTRDIAEYVLDYVAKNPCFVKRFNHTMCCDEIFFPTIFHGKTDQFHIQAITPLRYVSWEPNHEVADDYRPYTLDERDFSYIIGKQAFFCRKVDLPQSGKLLDLIDQHRNGPFDFDKAEPVIKLR